MPGCCCFGGAEKREDGSGCAVKAPVPASDGDAIGRRDGDGDRLSDFNEKDQGSPAVILKQPKSVYFSKDGRGHYVKPDDRDSGEHNRDSVSKNPATVLEKGEHLPNKENLVHETQNSVSKEQNDTIHSDQEVARKKCEPELKQDSIPVKETPSLGKQDNVATTQESGPRKQDSGPLKQNSDLAKQDSGPSKQDPCSPKQNTGNPKQDSDPPKQDSGPSKQDSDSPKQHSGPPKQDSNMPKQDLFPPRQGTAPPKQELCPPKLDTGPPKQDSDLPKQDSGSPIQGSGPPKQDTGNPKQDTGIPKEDPASRKEDSVQDKENQFPQKEEKQRALSNNREPATPINQECTSSSTHDDTSPVKQNSKPKKQELTGERDTTTSDEQQVIKPVMKGDDLANQQNAINTNQQKSILDSSQTSVDGEQKGFVINRQNSVSKEQKTVVVKEVSVQGRIKLIPNQENNIPSIHTTIPNQQNCIANQEDAIRNRQNISRKNSLREILNLQLKNQDLTSENRGNKLTKLIPFQRRSCPNHVKSRDLQEHPDPKRHKSFPVDWCSDAKRRTIIIPDQERVKLRKKDSSTRNRRNSMSDKRQGSILDRQRASVAVREGINSDDEVFEKVDGGVEKKWARESSLRRTFNRPRHNNSHQPDPSAHSDTEISKISAPHSLVDGECGSVGDGSVSSERGIDVGRVTAWATSFEKLLEDPAGLHTFAEFLKKEYSHENIYFWTACERYKRLSNPDDLRTTAKEIFERHLCSRASEPVNVDAQARQDAQDGLHAPNESLFSQAQKQIFNLMKFDSYSRFLKSNLYKECESLDMRGQPLPYPGDDTLDPDLRIVHEDSLIKLKKSKSDADERRRKSLLPWHRKDRSKSKDRGEAEYRRKKKMGQRNASDSSSTRSDMSGSRTSLNSSDLPLGRRAVSKESLTSGELGSLSGSEGYNRCRVILPDLSNSVVAIKPGESVQELLTRLLERRGISYSTFDVYQHKTDKLLDKAEDSSIIGGMEVRLEQRILFRLDLPNRKTVCVKAKPNKFTNDVLKPILHKYGYKLDLMSIHKVGEEKGVNLKCQVNELDGDRLVVQTKEEVKEWSEPSRQKKRVNTLDEITNKVFEDLLKGKSEQNFDELGILDFDARSTRTDLSSDRSSGILGSFSRRNSLAPEKDGNNKPRKANNRASVHENMSVRGILSPAEHAMVTKRRGNSNPANAKQENDELYEGLKRAQRSRLDDQRGTEINFELPDFLKCDQPQDKENQHAHLADQLLAHLECTFSDGSIIPNHQEAEEYFSIAHPEVWGGIPTNSASHSANVTLMAQDIDIDDLDETIRADDSLCKVPLPETSSSSLHMDAPDFSPPPPLPMDNSVPAVSRMPPPALLLSPPPLPPKPKIGGMRGPPPRPPSRQLHLLNPPTFSSTSDDDGLHAVDPPIHITRQSHDKFNISFV